MNKSTKELNIDFEENRKIFLKMKDGVELFVSLTVDGEIRISVDNRDMLILPSNSNSIVLEMR